MINDGAIRVDPASDPIQSLPIPASQAVVNHESSTISITSTTKMGVFGNNTYLKPYINSLGEETVTFVDDKGVGLKWYISFCEKYPSGLFYVTSLFTT